MKNNWGNLLVLVCTVCLTCWQAEAITPEEVYQDGRRAFDLGHWAEAKDHFSRFGQTWPTHGLAVQSLLYETLSEIRAKPAEEMESKADRVSSLSSRLRLFREKLPTQDLSELEVALQLESPAPDFLSTTTAVLSLSPEKLHHLLRRGFLPGNEQGAIPTLSWIREWRSRYPRGYPSGLLGRLEFLKAKALWSLYLSPLPARSHSGILKTWGEWPLETSLGRSIRMAFASGEPEVKREAALLGVAVDWVVKNSRRNPVLPENSEWMRYLRERGIHEEEAWSPR